MYDNWDDLQASIVGCKNCKLCENRKNIVFGQGNKNADIMFIGEYPGIEDDLNDRVFIGKAGQLMNKVFEGIGIRRERIYISNVIKCRLPLNRVPDENECQTCLEYLRNQVVLIKPKIIVLLGPIALMNILGKEYEIASVRGKWIEKKGIKYMPTWNPEILVRDEDKKIEFWNDLKVAFNFIK